MELEEHLTKYVDKCYNNFVYYQTQGGIDLIFRAQDLLQQKTCRFWIDGRRIMTYFTGNYQEVINEESIQLLKKKADIKDKG
ncbi:hypothetical protein J1N35_008287 [Gossypium stocksii]|uniref:Uncharacterized protein n=1 Tax=Gossypium stocksii TaxID=47602 RepID=A0A9D3W7F6_9ROSI|nr:hypothetical protein J1N35_008287 [Gossypium stocksii]